MSLRQTRRARGRAASAVLAIAGLTAAAPDQAGQVGADAVTDARSPAAITRRDVTAPQILTPPDADALDEGPLAGGSDSELAAPASVLAPQVDTGPRIAGSAQVYRGGPTAQPVDPLSSPAQGRRQALETLNGSDRCDPQAAGAGGAGCRRVIETRADEFRNARPQALSPEQRLLVDRRVLAAPESTEAVIDRIGRTRTEPDSPGALGVAAMALGTAPGATAGRDAAADATEGTIDGGDVLSDALVRAIVEGATADVPR